MPENVRNTLWRSRKRRPSAMSARRVVCFSRGIRYSPRTSSSAATATAHSATGVPSAAMAPAAASTPASGGPGELVGRLLGGEHAAVGAGQVLPPDDLRND